MLDQATRATILNLHERGHGVRSIARTLRVTRDAVRAVLRSGTGQVPHLDRPEKAGALRDEIAELYVKDNGNLVRVHKDLCAAGATLSYPALTAFCRRHGIGHEPAKPSGRYHFEPGEEMQHDTSPHQARIGGKLDPIRKGVVDRA